MSIQWLAMKKTALKTKLVLQKQTIKALVEADASQVIGGADQGPSDKQAGCPVIVPLIKP